MDKQIYLFLKKLRRRIGLQKALNVFPFFLAIGCMIAFFHVGIAYIYPFYYANMIGLFWIVFSFFLGTIYFFWHFPKEAEAAHTGDTVIGQERLLTALELRGNESAISYLQKEDTIYHISNCNFKTSFPYHFPVQRIVGFLFMLFLFLLFLFLPSNAKTTALELHKVKQQAKKEILALEEAQKELKAAKNFSKSSNLKEKSLEEKKQQLSSLLEESKKEYGLAKSQKDLTKTKERLEAKINAISKKAGEEEEWKKTLSLVSSLPMSAENNSSNNSQKTSKNNSEFSENKLKNKDLESKSIEKQNSAKNNEGTKNASDSDTDKTSSTNSTSDNSSPKDSSKDNHSSTHNSNDKDNTTTNSNATAKKDSENFSSKTETGSSKEALKSGENNQKNNGSENSEKGNSQNNRSTGSGNSLENGSGNGTGYNYGNKKGIEKKRDRLQEPEQITVIEHAIGEEENLTGTSSKDGNSYMETGDSPLNSGTKKDFYDVIGDYTQKAYSAVENNKVSLAMADVVKNYFSNLNS